MERKREIILKTAEEIGLVSGQIGNLPLRHGCETLPS